VPDVVLALAGGVVTAPAIVPAPADGGAGRPGRSTADPPSPPGGTLRTLPLTPPAREGTVTLSEKSRSAIYRGLASVVQDEEAIEEMLSHFPAREVEELVTKDFLRAEMAELRSELHDEIRRAVMWMTTTVIAAAGAVIAATAVVAG
jgi:hypothetical protein